jgi:hypothetical protein
MSVGGGIVIPMTRTLKTTVKILTAILVSLASFSITSPAQAVVNENSRVVIVDLPKVAEKLPTAIIIANYTDGTVQAYITHTENGFVRIMFDNPKLIKTLKARVGERNYRVDGFSVTNIAAPSEAHGTHLTFEYQGVNGEWKVMNIDGSISSVSIHG